MVDDLQGTTHQVYGGLADPTYLIDADGRVAFYDMWTHAPTLHKAIEELMNQDGPGILKGGTERAPHLLTSMTDGWKGLPRRASGKPSPAPVKVGLAVGVGVLIALGANARRRTKEFENENQSSSRIGQNR